VELAIAEPFQDFFNTPDAGEVDIIYGSMAQYSAKPAQ